MSLISSGLIDQLAQRALQTINDFNNQNVALLNPRHQVAPYLDYKIDQIYLWDEGTIQVPIAEDPEEDYLSNYNSRPTSEIVRTAAPFGSKLVHIYARRLNAMPILPDPTPQDSNTFIKKVIIKPSSPVIVADMKSRIFVVEAAYLYFMKTPIWVAQDSITLPKNDADGYSRVIYTIDTPQFQTGMIEDTLTHSENTPIQ